LAAKEGLFKVVLVHDSFRYLESVQGGVAGVLEAEYGIGGVKGGCGVLEIVSLEYKHSESFYLVLLHEWAKLKVEIGDTLYIFGRFNPKSNSLLLRSLKERKPFSQTEFAILCPEVKIGVTDLTSKSECLRSTTLSKFFEVFDSFGIPAIEGRVHHNVFEEVILGKDVKAPAISEASKKAIVLKHLSGWDLEVLYYLKADYNLIFNTLTTSIEKTQDWKRRFIGPDCEPIWLSKEQDIKMKVLGVDTTEKKLHSDKYGLVGIIDAVF
jgi:hypothetical protein